MSHNRHIQVKSSSHCLFNWITTSQWVYCHLVVHSHLMRSNGAYFLYENRTNASAEFPFYHQRILFCFYRWILETFMCVCVLKLILKERPYTSHCILMCLTRRLDFITMSCIIFSSCCSFAFGTGGHFQFIPWILFLPLQSSSSNTAQHDWHEFL